MEKRNFGFTFGRTKECHERDYQELEKRLAEMGKPDSAQPASDPQPSAPQIGHAMVISANVKPEDYIQVGINGLNGQEVLISKFEFPNANNKNYEDTNKFVLQQGLYIPTPIIFMTHFKNVVNAYETRNSKVQLFDGKGNPLTGKELEEIYLHFVKCHIFSYKSRSAGAWSWLNGKFVKGSGFNNLDLETITGLDSQGKLTTQKSPLEICEWSDSCVNLDFNSQGMAKSKAQNQKYIQGKNIHFAYPRLDCVIRFYACSGKDNFFCNVDPTFTDAGLGAFACIDGPIVKNSGGAS